MKHLALFTLLFLTYISQASAQRKWEMGVTVLAGNYTTTSDQTKWYSGNTYSERERISPGMSTSLGLYIQRRIVRGLAVSAGLRYTLSQFTTQRDMKMSIPQSGIDQTRTESAIEQRIFAPIELHFNASRWSLGVGGGGSYHLNTTLESWYTDHLNPLPPITTLPIVFCGAGLTEWLISPGFQWLWSGSLEYRLGKATRIGLNAIVSFKKNQINGGYYFEDPTYQGLTGSGLPVFPRSLSVSLRHSFLK